LRSEIMLDNDVEPRRDYPPAGKKNDVGCWDGALGHHRYSTTFPALRSLPLGQAVTAQLWLFVFCAALSGAQAKASVIELYPIDKACACIMTLTSIPGIQFFERIVGREIYQVFQDRRTGRELFRFSVGSRQRGGDLKYWRYGIAVRGDFNVDEVEDYAWAGGDDTSEALYLLLSSSAGYRKIDIIATFEAAWRQTYRSANPDFALILGPVVLGTITLERGASGLILAGRASNADGLASPSEFKFLPARLRVRETEFVIRP